MVLKAKRVRIKNRYKTHKRGYACMMVITVGVARTEWLHV
jgi:hypothetical protein